MNKFQKGPMGFLKILTGLSIFGWNFWWAGKGLKMNNQNLIGKMHS